MGRGVWLAALDTCTHFSSFHLLLYVFFRAQSTLPPLLFSGLFSSEPQQKQTAFSQNGNTQAKKNNIKKQHLEYTPHGTKLSLVAKK